MADADRRASSSALTLRIVTFINRSVWATLHLTPVSSWRPWSTSASCSLHKANANAGVHGTCNRSADVVPSVRLFAARPAVPRRAAAFLQRTPVWLRIDGLILRRIRTLAAFGLEVGFLSASSSASPSKRATRTSHRTICGARF
jgi:hypothetical protein